MISYHKLSSIRSTCEKHTEKSDTWTEQRVKIWRDEDKWTDGEKATQERQDWQRRGLKWKRTQSMHEDVLCFWQKLMRQNFGDSLPKLRRKSAWASGRLRRACGTSRGREPRGGQGFGTKCQCLAPLRFSTRRKGAVHVAVVVTDTLCVVPTDVVASPAHTSRNRHTPRPAYRFLGMCQTRLEWQEWVWKAPCHIHPSKEIRKPALQPCILPAEPAPGSVHPQGGWSPRRWRRCPPQASSPPRSSLLLEVLVWVHK